MDLQPIKVAQLVRLLHDATATHAVTRRFSVSPGTISRVYQKWAVTQGHLDRAVDGHQPSDTAGICSFVKRGN